MTSGECIRCEPGLRALVHCLAGTVAITGSFEPTETTVASRLEEKHYYPSGPSSQQTRKKDHDDNVLGFDFKLQYKSNI